MTTVITPSEGSSRDGISTDLSPLVSIIVPTCRRNELALQCIDSILASRYSKFQLIIVDQDPAQSLGTEIRSRYRDETRIQYCYIDIQALDVARNAGLDKSQGSIVIFADDDIQVDPGWVGAYVEAFSTLRPQPAVVGGRIDPLWLGERPRWMPPEKEYLLGLYPEDYPLGPMREGDLPIGANFAALKRHCTDGDAFDRRLDYSYSRKSSLLSGGDSLFSLELKRRGYTIGYQPSARVWHKISSAKLNPGYMVRRHFWEGVTYITVQFISGALNPTDCPAIIRWHVTDMLLKPPRAVWHAVVHRSDPWSRVLARIVFAWSYSWGIVSASLRLIRRRTLP